MKILGLDPGYGRLGWGLVEKKGSAIHCLGCGVIETPAGQAFELRLLAVAQGVTQLVKKHAPTEAAVETLYFSKNVKTALKVAEARGAIRVTLAGLGIPALEFQPQEVKMALAGSGNAAKPQVGRMVVRLLGLKTLPKPDDAADALALAITSLRSAPLRKLKQRLQKP